jgi:hypothetical protein
LLYKQNCIFQLPYTTYLNKCTSIPTFKCISYGNGFVYFTSTGIRNL